MEGGGPPKTSLWGRECDKRSTSSPQNATHSPQRLATEKDLTIPLTNSRQIDLSEPHNALYFVRIEKVSAIVRKFTYMYQMASILEERGEGLLQ